MARISKRVVVRRPVNNGAKRKVKIRRKRR